jgi:hypothetical protein
VIRQITRDAHGALISYAEENVSGVHLVISPEELAVMTDEDVLAVHNPASRPRRRRRQRSSGSPSRCRPARRR